MRGPLSVYLNPPAFGRSRTKAGGFVRFGAPSGELLRVSVAERAKPVTDSGDLAGGGSGMRVNWGLSNGWECKRLVRNLHHVGRGRRPRRPVYRRFMTNNQS